MGAWGSIWMLGWRVARDVEWGLAPYGPLSGVIPGAATVAWTRPVPIRSWNYMGGGIVYWALK